MEGATGGIRKFRHCLVCGEQIPKKVNISWAAYNKSSYCKRECYHLRDRSGKIKEDINEPGTDELSISEYIKSKSKNGRLMADWNLGVIKAVTKSKDETVEGAAKGTICLFKGVQITADMVKSSNAWLMDNWIGKAGQRTVEPERDDRTEEQKMDELKFTLKELGYGIYELRKYKLELLKEAVISD